MMWQHCGRLDDHDEHQFTARLRVVVESCTCGAPLSCLCPADEPGRARPKQQLRCPGKQERSVEVPVTTEVGF